MILFTASNTPHWHPTTMPPPSSKRRSLRSKMNHHSSSLFFQRSIDNSVNQHRLRLRLRRRHPTRQYQHTTKNNEVTDNLSTTRIAQLGSGAEDTGGSAAAAAPAAASRCRFINIVIDKEGGRGPQTDGSTSLRT